MSDVTERRAVADLIEELRLGLITRATGGSMDFNRYRELRRALLGMPSLKNDLPRYLRTCASPDDFWTFIKGEFSTYQERRTFITSSLQPLIDRLEGLERIAANDLSIGEVLGRGGFGTVYRTHHQVLDMDFALKVFEPAFDDGSAAPLERFFREARILFLINHPNIVRFFDAGYLDGKPFLRMELINGKTLSQYLRDHGPMPSAKAAILVRKMLEALRYAHEEAKVCHRDLKPSNVMVAPGEIVKVLDFGVGVFIEQELVSRLTRTGDHLVAGLYSAPELVSDPKAVDPRADLYSVGAIWFAVLTGRPPAGSDVATQLTSVPQLTERYRRAVMQSLAEVTKRFQSAAEMLTEVCALEDQSAGMPSSTQVPPLSPGPTGSGVSGMALTLEYKSPVSTPSQWVAVGFRLANTGTVPVPLADVTLRYWFNAPQSTAYGTQCSYALGPAQCAHLILSFDTVSNRIQANRTFNIAFRAAAGNLSPGASNEVQLQFHQNDWATIDQGTHYSHASEGVPAFTKWSRITGYLKGVLIWGDEPH